MIYIAGGTLSMQALVGRSLDFMCTGGTPFIYAYLEGVQGKIIGGVNNRLPYGFVSLANIRRRRRSSKAKESASAVSAAPTTSRSN